MEEKTLFLSPFRGLTELIKEAAREYGKKEIEIVNEIWRRQDLQSLVKCSGLDKYRVIVATDYLLSCLPPAFGKPMISLHVSAFDLLSSLLKIKEITSCQKIAYIGYFRRALRYDFKALEEILQREKLQILPFTFKEDVEIDSLIKQAIAAGAEIIVGTGICIVKKASAFKIPAQVIYPNKDSIFEALSRVEEVLSLHQREIERTRQLAEAFNCMSEGVIVLNSKGKVILANKKVAEFFHLSGGCGELLGISSGEGNGKYSFLKDLSSLGFHSCKTIEVKDERLIATSLPIWLGEKDQLARLITLQKAHVIESLDLRLRRDAREKRLVAKATFRDIIGESRVMRDVVGLAQKVALTDSTVLITGESGTGKEIFAQSIHNGSSRKDGPFVAVNCASIPESILDSELFGYEKGTFTGADKSGKPGLFELAHKGTIFLDEISELSFPLQAKLLRVLQEKEIRRLGGNKNIPVDVRVIAATNSDIKQLAKAGKFRSDLYFRLDVLRLALPPLREHKEDIPKLANYFYQKKRQELGFEGKNPALPQEVIEEFQNYSWPGNVRELQNSVERYLLTENLGFSKEPSCLQQGCSDSKGQGLGSEEEEAISIPVQRLPEVEEEVLRQVMEKYGLANKKQIAEALGISRTTLWRKLKTLGVSK